MLSFKQGHRKNGSLKRLKRGIPVAVDALARGPRQRGSAHVWVASSAAPRDRRAPRGVAGAQTRQWRPKWTLHPGLCGGKGSGLCGGPRLKKVPRLTWGHGAKTGALGLRRPVPPFLY
ncbi:hypothetical protein DPEC_G00200110 [Dallia pectoralis]|uniref:Uncharacterized protein n=1 Tax=Dallia pectoralis TaxID=75939 RepID=A0ACC2G8E9_DALPE|nr:hypothetical protein DPEC_G00200110 [Dallia pectoralis]